MRCRFFVLIVCATPALHGCGTVLNMCHPETRAFGGVETDAILGPCFLASGVTRAVVDSPPQKFSPEVEIGLGAWALVDLPFSVIGDIVTLPWAVRAELARLDQASPEQVREIEPAWQREPPATPPAATNPAVAPVAPSK
jgi:uncharacterized protein YceK